MSYFKHIKQDIVTSTNNFTTDNIASGATWSGTADETLGINGIQFYHFADVNTTISLEQGIDETFATGTTVVDSISCLANNPYTRTFVSVSPYFRLVVENTDITTSTIHITAAGLTPIINPLPRALSEDERLKTETHIADQDDRHVKITGQQELLTSPVYRLVGTAFVNSYYDTNFWLTGSTNGGTVVFDGDATISTSTNTAGSASLSSVRKARFVPGSSNMVRGVAKLTTMPVAGNYRRFGAYDTNDGYFFQISGTTFGLGYRKAGTDTIIENGSFNGGYGPSVPVGTQKFSLGIEYGTGGASWYMNNVLVHKVNVSTATITQTLNFPIFAESVNTGSAANNGILLFNTSIFRLGELKTNPTSKWISGVSAGIQLKYGAGMLHRVVNLDNQGGISIYDGTSSADPQLAYIDCTKVTGSIDFDIPFSDGLFIVTTDAQHSSVTVYE